MKTNSVTCTQKTVKFGLEKLNAAFEVAASAGSLPEADRLRVMNEGAAIPFAEALKISLTI
jgi:hypothetical protein